MRLLVCGGRDYRDAGAVADVLGSVQKKCGISFLIHGGAAGADRLAAQWAHAHKVPVLTFDADWYTHGKAAGPIRNARMIAEGRPDGVVAFPGGRGTADMIRQAGAAGLVVWKILLGVDADEKPDVEISMNPQTTTILRI